MSVKSLLHDAKQAAMDTPKLFFAPLLELTTLNDTLDSAPPKPGEQPKHRQPFSPRKPLLTGIKHKRPRR
jgi:hypothetical protein